MKLLQIGTFDTGSTRGSWLRSKVRVFGMRKLMRKGVLANTRILDAPTHAHFAALLLELLGRGDRVDDPAHLTGPS